MASGETDPETGTGSLPVVDDDTEVLGATVERPEADAAAEREAHAQAQEEDEAGAQAAEAEAGPAAASEAAEPAGANRPRNRGLRGLIPRTGADALTMAAIGLALVAVGVGVTRLGRGHRQRHPR